MVYGLEQDSKLKGRMEISYDIPSVCAQKLKNNEIDLGLVPVAIIPEIEPHFLLEKHCIGAFKKVDTVLLLSDVPLNEIEHVFLDYQSKTSVNLCKLLFKNHWKQSVNFLDAKKEYESNIKGTKAGVIIGDRTFTLERNYQYQYDLSEAWYEHTGLPFVFAAWVANKPLDEDFISNFELAIKYGIEHISEAISASEQKKIDSLSLSNYLNNSIDYRFDEAKKKALDRFLMELKNL